MMNRLPKAGPKQILEQVPFALAEAVAPLRHKLITCDAELGEPIRAAFGGVGDAKGGPGQTSTPSHLVRNEPGVEVEAVPGFWHRDSKPGLDRRRLVLRGIGP